MNRKQLIALLVLLLVLGGAGIAVYRRNSSSWQPAPPSGKVLGDFALNDVARVVIQSGTGTVTLAKKDGKWAVGERDDYPADFSHVSDFIQALWQLKTVEDVQAGPSQLGRLDLLSPDTGLVNNSPKSVRTDLAGTGTLIDLQNKDSKRIAALLAGKKYLKKSPQFPDGIPAGRYVMPAGSTPPKVSLVSDPLEPADAAPVAWLDREFLHIGRVQSVALASGTNQWKVSRDTDSAPGWNLAGSKPGEKLDPAKTPFADIIGNPEFVDVLPASAKPDGFDTTVTVTTLDHFTYTLKFGKPDGGNLPMSVAVTADLPKERTPGAIESPEEKKKLDEQFAANSKRLADEFARAKTFQSRIYLVPQDMFQPLFQPRSAMLAAPSQAPPQSFAPPSFVPQSLAPPGPVIHAVQPAKASPSPKGK